MLLILCDIHQNILSAQYVIFYSTSKSKSNIEVYVKENNISMNIYSDSVLCQQLTIDLPKNLFNPCTTSFMCCHNSVDYTVNKENNEVRWKSNWAEGNNNLHENVFKINFRIQIADSCAIKNLILRESCTFHYKEFIKKKFDDCENYSNFNLYCTNCSTLLSSKEISFQSVSQYHEGTSELSETWFCHKHGTHETVQQNDNILYIGDIYFYINTCVVNNLLLLKNDKEYRCVECSSILSLKRSMNSPNYVGFFTDKVMFKKSGTELSDINKYRNDITLFSFYNIFEEILRSNVSCKMYLQSKVDEDTECLLLWANSQKVAQFLLYEEDNKNIPIEAPFTVHEVYKVLYRISTPDSDVARKWKYDFNVEFFQISDNMMKVIRQVLQNSKYGVDDKETINGFLFGYLPVFPGVK